jgi:ketosteroid isomerase-like protein
VAGEDVELVRQLVRSFNRRDIAAMTQMFDPEIEWKPGGPAAVERDLYRGRKQVAGGFVATWDAWELFHLEESEVRDLGDSILWLGRTQMRGGASQVDLDQEFAILFQVRGGKIFRFRGFRGWQEAFEAAGRAE